MLEGLNRTRAKLGVQLENDGPDGPSVDGEAILETLEKVVIAGGSI